MRVSYWAQHGWQVHSDEAGRTHCGYGTNGKWLIFFFISAVENEKASPITCWNWNVNWTTGIHYCFIRKSTNLFQSLTKCLGLSISYVEDDLKTHSTPHPLPPNSVVCGRRRIISVNAEAKWGLNGTFIKVTRGRLLGIVDDLAERPYRKTIWKYCIIMCSLAICQFVISCMSWMKGSFWWAIIKSCLICTM